MEQVVNVSGQINTATEEQKKGNEEIVGMIESLKNVSSGNREIVGELMSILDKFKLTEEG